MIQKNYPHVVIRWMAAAYSRRSIVFVDKLPLDPEPASIYVILEGEPYLKGRLLPGARQALIQRVLQLSKETGFRMCVVLGRSRAVFCEPDGSMKKSGEPPSGGMRIDPVVVVGQSGKKPMRGMIDA